MTLKTVAHTLLWLVVAALPAYTANAATLRDVRHIVIILKENHTFDNYFGLFRGADGSTTGVHEGRLRAAHTSSRSTGERLAPQTRRRLARLGQWTDG